MTKFLKSKTVKSAIAAGLMLGAAVAQPAVAQTSSGQLVPGLGVANLQVVVANSTAFKTADQQRNVHYKPQIDQAEARGAQINAQLKPLYDKVNAESRAPNPNQASLAQQVAQIQKIEQAGQQEINEILKPYVYSKAYVEEQILGFFDQAVEKAMEKRRISIVLQQEAVFALNHKAYDLNKDIVNELNLLIPAAQFVPPAGWEPKQIRDAKAQQAAQQQAAGVSAPTATAGPQPVGR